MSLSEPVESTLCATFGASRSNARIAPDVWARARSSSTWPSSTNVTITAAASKYNGGAPDPSANEGGRMPGAAVATTEKIQAAPVPSAMSVNMLRLRLRTDCQPRTKNGHPPHSTTGVASSSWPHATAE
jgi:hypothetical protein